MRASDYPTSGASAGSLPSRIVSSFRILLVWDQDWPADVVEIVPHGKGVPVVSAYHAIRRQVVRGCYQPFSTRRVFPNSARSPPFPRNRRSETPPRVAER